ncbi:adenosylmethionine--8-amino-7-oxononanoate transaminase [Pseudodesulfovibrio cashew]|uniref:adenosylmethionine--8-amino-7-oxononanoate transaminase n=1 Tax=Pseudodesulfovibrio cashew TaxID=2678688 RepID=UPI001F559D35|nr:adenosylmethionine--8-amino-7-oxononanoate transaminase [Pseudodesulfovibrio cashew]
MTKGFFVTGTDTGVGKTRVTALLLRALLDAGHPALAVKAIQTGCRETADGLQAEDVEIYANYAGDHFPDGYPDACCRKFLPACSPHLAAELSGVSIDPDRLADEIRGMAEGHTPVLVEGAGGAAVPLGNGATTLDLMQRLDLPVIIVADNKLGMINHALMTVEAVRDRGLSVAGVVVNNTTPANREDAFLRRDNVAAIAEYGEVPILADIPHSAARTNADPACPNPMDGALASLLLEPEPPSDDLDFDRTHLWHPYTSATRPLPATKVVAARGTRLVLKDGSELVDGMASWWCAVHGYNHPALNRAAREQIGRMSHVMFGGLTHEPAVELGRALIGMAPEGLDHCFLADSGSVSVEVAIKMALQYMQASGRTERTKLFTVRGGYHGDTCGCMSVCDPDGGMHHLFSGLLPRQVFAPRPDCRFGAEYDPSSLAQARDVFERHAREIAAIIVEPIVQGAGGMRFYHPDYLRGLRELADEHGVLLILDEIATGFGRTGKLFACQWADVVPDIMCVGKALSGGYMTLAATLATRDVADTISADGGVLMHGPTFMGNPLACAVAKASLDILRQNAWQTQVREIEGWLEHSLEGCRSLADVTDVRVLGAIGVVELKHQVNVQEIQKFFISRGVWLRPFGKLLYAMPPYIISRDEVARLGKAIFDAIATGRHV